MATSAELKAQAQALLEQAEKLKVQESQATLQSSCKHSCVFCGADSHSQLEARIKALEDKVA